MELLLKRIYKGDKYTIGKLYIDGKYFCDTCEDKDRGITQTTPLSQIKKIKVSNETAIPTGTYNITLNVVSPKYSNFAKYKYTKTTGGKMPRLLNVPGYEGVLIHAGNSAKDSSGCILVGKNTVVGKVTNSQNTFLELYAILKQANNKNEKITITIK